MKLQIKFTNMNFNRIIFKSGLVFCMDLDYMMAYENLLSFD